MDVEVKESAIPGAGRGLFANKDFQPGDAVLRLPRPYLAELFIDRMQDTCAWCFLRGATDPIEREASKKEYLPPGYVETQACSGCKKVRYCSKACQTKAWKREHKYECKVLAPAERPDLPEGVRAVIKLLGRLKADPEGKDERLLEILQFKPSLDGDMMQRFVKDHPELYEEHETMAYAAWKYAGEPVMGDTESLPIAKAFFFNITHNATSLSAPYNDDRFGRGFDPVLCSANHSCDPNTAMVFNQPEQILRAIKPIKKGDEVTMKYVDVTNPWSVRRDELKRKYYFDCECSKCRLGPTTSSELFLKPSSDLGAPFTTTADGLIERHADTLATHLLPGDDQTGMRRLAAMQAEAFSVSGFSQDSGGMNKQASESEIKDALRLCLNSGMWSYQRQPVPHLLKQLLKYYIETRQKYPAWRVALKMYFTSAIPGPPDFPNFYPDRLIDVWTLAFLTNTLCRPDMSYIRQECMEAGFDLMIVFVGLVFEVWDNLDKAWGKDSPFGKVVATVREQIMASAPMGEQGLREKVREVWPKLEVVGNSVDVLNL